MNVVCVPCEGRVNAREELDFGEAPVITSAMYEARLAALLDAGKAFSHLVMYADREHFSNLEYVTGYDPRYEECVLILQRGTTPMLVVGNEGMGQSQCLTIAVERVLFQSLSPLGQARGASLSLAAILAKAGIDRRARVGLLGWKMFSAMETAEPLHTFEVPSFLVDALRTAAGSVENANGLMMDNATGLRQRHSAEELILSELASAKASRKTWDFICGLRPGLTELEASQGFAIDGEPCPTHPNICFRGKGILSPDAHTRLDYGQPIAFGMGYRYAQIHRVGVYARDRAEFDARFPGAFEGLYERYFLALCAWYEHIGLGVTGGEVWEAVRAVVGSYADFGIGLNPGHAIHSEEWLNSPFSENDTTRLCSGMMLQCDFTARPARFDFLGVHVEDGVLLADAALQTRMEELAPACMRRIRARQAFMRETLGIALRDEVLPTSDLCGMLHPFLATPNTVFAKRG